MRSLIGLTGQYAAVDEMLTGVENLVMIGRLLGLSRRSARARAIELLERFDLADAGGRAAKTYSGGMRRRLDLAASLVGRPQVLFLDEPTTGLDPRSRTELWGVVRGLMADGVTVLLTTQYLEEADQLADDIVVFDHGKVIASGTSDELKATTGGAGAGGAAAGDAPARPGRARSSPTSWPTGPRPSPAARSPSPCTTPRCARHRAPPRRSGRSSPPSWRCASPAWTRCSWP